MAYIANFHLWAIWLPPSLIKDSETPVWLGVIKKVLLLHANSSFFRAQVQLVFLFYLSSLKQQHISLCFFK